MKKSITLALVILYGFALVRPAFPLIDYFVKLKEYEARCINKQRPDMHCNGRCILMQKLKALNASEEPSSPPFPVKISFEDYPLALNTSIDQASKSASLDDQFICQLRVGNPSAEYLTQVFRPPLG